LQQLFARVGYKPARVKDIVKRMSSAGITDVAVALTHFIREDRHTAGWRSLLNSLEPFEKSM
jgi:hypothetical protein